MNEAAIVVPVSGTAFTDDEEVSLRHLEHYLGSYDRFFVAPRGCRIRRAGFEVAPLPGRYFGSARAHARLQLSERFYTRFQSYKYILMYHLDALVLADRLSEWCATDVDFVGAPWLPCADSPWVTHARVGNSGFALMKVESFLRVIRSPRPAVDPDDYWRRLRAATPPYRRLLQMPRRYLKYFQTFNGAKWEMRRWPLQGEGLGNCDYFWAERASHFWPAFRIATVEQALAFAFEVAPRRCYELNGRRLPFGAHAWTRYDRSFWEPHLIA